MEGEIIRICHPAEPLSINLLFLSKFLRTPAEDGTEDVLFRNDKHGEEADDDDGVVVTQTIQDGVVVNCANSLESAAWCQEGVETERTN